MLGDTAVWLTKTPRFGKYVGQDVILLIKIPVIGDHYVDMEFGTGALRVRLLMM